ncbi:uncharacterized protein PGTG_03235 [Puccinia graminis f. sp. tritici CRL 75-36-700-3]|uniref:GABA-specific high-affinity permease n=1 Tax=Puccinia graminis f. sp. tritici (strain CRL 75-36-700-3 / race SCCL) TaxID=418459 RepID=E3JZ04_PUCGT|nr:uncharacterized protein PGTG_03235 [Puccinia graminis f. sp. tritici CRL 75-36-700-3]EFP77279.2 hypothetical protein PGTG_03235 [Puccinia graminis f. sp. tritici CRL 75-36-700-3]
MLSSSAPLSKHPQDIGAGSPSLDKHLDKQTDSFPSTEDQDDVELAKLGYKSEFAREFGNFSTISFAFSIMGLCSSVTSTFNTPMLSGGPASVVWCWLLGSVMCFGFGTSIAELVSAYPTSGGLYSASAYLVPRRYRPFVGFTVGWLNILGQIAGVASTEFALSEMIWAAYTLMRNDDFSPSKSQTVGLYVGLLVLHGLLNCLATKALAGITKSFIFINLTGTMAMIIGLLATTPDKHDASYIFTKVTDQTGWGNDGLAFLLGLLSVQWTMTDYDATAHISEEVKRAAIAAPVAIFVAVAGRDYSASFSVVLTALQANSRTIFSFSRDGGLPDRGIFSRLSAQKVPVYAVWSVIIVSILMGLLKFASTVALNAIFSLCTIALDSSYAIPIAMKLIYMDHPEVQFKPGPFSLGRGTPLMWFVNLLSLAWVSFVVVILALPTVVPVTALNMNYASVITFIVLSLSTTWYLTSARHWYVGPKSNLH